MGIINVLDKSIAELIAAGEVVERPASVIKELTENSIDAGATAITVEIKSGGVKYIRITDNGIGIEKEDVPKAFLRHATSKVSRANDLDSIATLGFRGEALASICAVSKVQMLTRHKDEEIGTLYEINASEEQVYQEAGCPQGTTIIVKDIFYNVPARMKFLKKDIAEGNAIANIMDKLAMSHSEVAFTFIRDGKQVLKTPGDNKLKSAVYAVYGKEFVSKLIPLEYSYNNVSIYGYITKPEFGRANRNMQNFFINGRYVKSVTACKALEEAYKGRIMAGKLPSCVLHINLPLESIDVNVHPAKTEVRFINERPVFDIVYHGVKTALMKFDTPKEINFDVSSTINAVKRNPFEFVDSGNFKQQKAETISLVSNAEPVLEEQHFSDDITPQTVTVKDDAPEIFSPARRIFDISENRTSEQFTETTPKKKALSEKKDIPQQTKSVFNEKNQNTNQEEICTQPQIAAEFENVPNDHSSISKEKSEITEISVIAETEELKYLGEAFSTYILVQKGKDKIIFIDKHAAHERIIYEKLKKEHGKGYMQGLITPVVITLTKEEYNAVTENAEKLKEYNFEIDDFGNGKVAVRGIPQYVEHCSIEDMIVEIATNLIDKKKDLNTEQMDWIYHSVSCRSAIKAGNKNYESELMEIARRVDSDETIRYCPHGRPVCFVLTKKELEKQFGRV